MGILPTRRFDQDLGQTRRVESVVRGYAGHDLGHAVAIAVVGELGGRRAADYRSQPVGAVVCKSAGTIVKK